MNAATETISTESVQPKAMKHRRRHGRRMGGGSSIAAQGEPMLWLSGGALAIALVMIFGLLGLILWFGGGTFWPVPVELVTLKNGTVYMGEVTRDDTYLLADSGIEMLPPDLAEAAQEAVQKYDRMVHRRLFRTANFELTGTHFHWVNDFAIAKKEFPDWALVVERIELGRFYGQPTSFVLAGELEVTTEGLKGEELDAARQEIWGLYNKHHGEVVARRKEIRRKEKFELGRESLREERARLAMRGAELDDGKDSHEYAKSQREYEKVNAEVEQEFVRIRGEIAELREENENFKLVLTTAQGVEKTLGLAEIVRIYPANRLSLGDKLGLYFSRWEEFLLADPREANSEGGVWPAIVGTVAMTMIMALAVVPFGVLAALYLREYAKAGPIVSAVRIAINNLAGVPSIVFGVFGLGFFCYIVGAGVDNAFFEANVADGNPVYGKGALVWASLTLALLTLPVVIVAAEEALSAVPNSMREGSYACGGSKWQTLRRIVLPHAMPGIMTGAILAMARGAGEVAPLMLVGAVKLAPELPVDRIFPFFHPERSFMHLGFHIYDLGFQSQNSEAAKPMVYTTTLLLIVIIASLNVIAVWLRGRLRRRFESNNF